MCRQYSTLMEQMRKKGHHSRPQTVHRHGIRANNDLQESKIFQNRKPLISAAARLLLAPPVPTPKIMSDIQTSIASFAHRNIPTRNQVTNEWDISLPSRSGSRAIKPSQRGEQSQISNPAAQRSPVAAANGVFSRCDESLGSLSFAKTCPPTSTQGTISPAKSLSNHTVKSTIHAPIIASPCNAVRDFSSPTAKTISALEINLQKRSKQLAQHGRWLQQPLPPASKHSATPLSLA